MKSFIEKVFNEKTPKDSIQKVENSLDQFGFKLKLSMKSFSSSDPSAKSCPVDSVGILCFRAI